MSKAQTLAAADLLLYPMVHCHRSGPIQKRIDFLASLASGVSAVNVAIIFLMLLLEDLVPGSFGYPGKI